MKRITKISLIVSVILTFGAAGLLVGKDEKQDKDSIVPIKVSRIATSPTEWELVSALTGRDILKEEGVEIKEVSGGSTGWLFMLILLNGDVDVSGGGWPGWINARARGGKIKAVLSGSSSYHYWPGRQAGLLVLENSSIHSIKDLEGKTIAVNLLGLTGDYVVRTMLKKNGVPLDKVQIIPVPQQNQEQVLRSHQVDAIADTTDGGPNFQRILDRGVVRVIPGTGKFDVLGCDETIGMGFREDFIEKHPETVRRYVSAVEKARRILWDEYKKNPGRVIALYSRLVKEEGGNPELAKYYLPPVHMPDYEFITGKEVRLWIKAMESEGQLKPGQVKAEDVFTNEFNPYYKKSN
jgi:ABC-type nitrate/sulfonate/bicarbonate transport system substrate-binding protein